MRCSDVQEWLPLWRDGEAGWWLALGVKTHVRRCAACRAHLQATDALTARLKAADPLNGYPLRTTSRSPAWGYARPALLAASLLIAASVGVWRGRTLTPRPPVAQRQPAPMKRPGAIVATHPQRIGAKTAPAVKAQAAVAVIPAKTIAARPRRSVRAAQRATRRTARVRQRFAAAERTLPMKTGDTALLAPIRTTPKTIPPSAEVVQVSVKIADPQQVAEEASAALARQEASREYIYVAVTSEPVETLAPAASPASAPSGPNLLKENQ